MNVYFSTSGDEENSIYGILISWEDDDGYGQVDIKSDDGKITMWAETMGKDFVKKLFDKIVDDAKIIE